MALNWDVSKIANYKVVTTHPTNEKKWHPVTEAIIWLTMSVDIGELTEKTINEFHWRMRLLQKLDGPNISFNDGTDVYITMQDLKDHLGLMTNVITIDRKKWLSKKITNETFVDLQTVSASSIINARAYEQEAKEKAND